MGIYSKNTKIARIYRGAAAEISTVRAAVSSNYGHTIHDAEKPFTLHRWLMGDNVANFQIEGIDLTQSNVDIVFSNTILQNTASVFSSTSSDCSINVIRSTSGGNNLIGIFRNRVTGGSEHIFSIVYLPATNKVSIQKPGVMVLNEVEYKTATTITDFKLKTSKCFGFVSSFQYGNLSLTPAQLTRDTYAREDINGRRRHVGEWVMVDVNKYAVGLPYILGNVAVSGAFSGSDYLIEGVDFERVAGVHFSSGQYINVDIALDSTDFAMRVAYSTTDKGSYFTPRYGTSKSIPYLIYNNSNRVLIIRDRENDKSYNVPYSATTEIEVRNDSININGETWNFSAEMIDVIGSSTTDVNINILSISKQGVIDLVPVRLKRNIEPYCTHNGKGGSEGEICFFDTVSGLAFVNDGTGAFTEYTSETT